ncbi:MAG TPA: metallophosphoesterase [Terracidiphilus sp.]|nr:metallophosphoesterase [Terracidiphilus sp.]
MRDWLPLSMVSTLPRSPGIISRRRFLTAGLCGAAGLVVYSGEVERHWIEVIERNVNLRSLPSAFDGMRITQISDIHMDDFTEPYFLRDTIERVNRTKPDAVMLTGDFVTSESNPTKASTLRARDAAWHCAKLLASLECRSLYAILGNHDIDAGGQEITNALASNGITVLRNTYLPIERAGSRIWLAGIDDPGSGHPDLEQAIPARIRNVPNEPVVLLCHAPDYADQLLTHLAGQAVDLMLSGHSHGGQIRLPLIGALVLPSLGRKYVEGNFQFGRMQLYVNRGIGTIGVPFRFDCPPEITVHTLRAGA